MASRSGFMPPAQYSGYFSDKLAKGILMRKHIIAIAVAALVSLVGCSKSSAPAAANQQATVQLHDGSSFAGTVTASSPSSITLQGGNGESRTYPMSQVASVQYADSTAAPAGSNAPPNAPPATASIGRRTPACRARASAASSASKWSGPFRPAPTFRCGTTTPISSQTAEDGQTFSGVVEADILDSSGRVAVPKGSNATLVVRAAASGAGQSAGPIGPFCRPRLGYGQRQRIPARYERRWPGRQRGRRRRINEPASSPAAVRLSGESSGPWRAAEKARPSELFRGPVPARPRRR